MRKTIFISLKLAALVAFVGLVSCSQPVKDVVKKESQTLKSAFEGKFLIGGALNTPQCTGEDTAALDVVKNQFNSIVAENCMKGEVIQPQQGVFDFTLSDQFVDFGGASNMFIIGHTLVWHSQAPPWIFVDAEGNDVSRDTLVARMKDHIYTVVGRYKGRVNGWDVVNEAIIDDAGLRESKWYQIIGPDYIELAFQFANEADPEAELYYNDYNLYQEHKRNETIKLVKSVQEKGLRIDGVGMQAHYGLGSNVVSDVEASIVAFSETGVKVMMTELDISVLPFPTEQITAEVSQSYKNKPEFNPYTEQLPDSVQEQFTQFYSDLFKVYIKHADKISRVTFWGVNDSQTWRNYWPINGRTDYPLFFDRNNQAKPVVAAVIGLVE
jgi:endo-1,4-beta-xylanase